MKSLVDTDCVKIKAEIQTVAESECVEIEENPSVMMEAESSVELTDCDDENNVLVEEELNLPELHNPQPSIDCNPEDRDGDRLMAAMGRLNDASPIFRETIQCWRVGVLLTIPLIVNHQILEAFQKVYGRLSGFFGLRNSLMSLLLMGFLRVKRLEQLKEKNPFTLGALIGLDRLPEMKTLRRKIKKMASMGKALELMRVLAHLRIKKQLSKNLLGFLYVDGYVKEYHGLAPLGKTYVARRNCINKGSSDIWVHDTNGDPLFVVPC